MTIVAAIVVAAGRGLRAGGGRAKQYRVLNGETPLRRSLSAFVSHPRIKLTQPVVHPDDEDLFADAAAGMALLPAVHGGATRQDSVRAGLEALAAAAPDVVLIHDAARPFLTSALIERAIEAALAIGAAVPGMPVVDTVKRVDANGVITDTLPRDPLRTVQTPQAFRFAPLLDAHRRAAAEKRNDFTDDGALAEWAGMAVSVFPGEAGNVKLTTADDFATAERGQSALEVRTATGFDVHQFGPGDHVMLGGLRIPHDRGVIGHSDADVALHALTDALLGALAEGDIGTHFPPSDPQWKGASSDRFLAFAAQRVTARGGRITLLDITMLSEAPRIGPHRDAIRQRIAEITGVHIGRVAIKATTTEQLGFVGRREGLAAIATATIQLPGDAP